MPAKKPSPIIEFVLAYLKKNPKAAFADVVEAGKKAGHKIVPVVYGRARVMAGLSPKKGKAAKKRGAGVASRGGPGRPPKNASATKRGPGRPKKVDELVGLVARLGKADKLEAAMREIQRVLRGVL